MYIYLHIIVIIMIIIVVKMIILIAKTYRMPSPLGAQGCFTMR